MYSIPPMWSRAFFCLLAFAFVQPARSQETRISGYMFGDVFVVAAHDDPDEVDDEDRLEGRTGLWFRRIYLTFDFDLNEDWKVRLRSEMNSAGDFVSRSSLEPYAKDAYVQWKRNNHQIRIGLSGTPTWDVIEEVWGYRSVAKTLLDLQRIGSSRDIGIAFKGVLDDQKKVQYNLMLANGSGTRSENNKGKKVLLSLGYRLTEEVIVEAYTDYEDRPGNTNRFTIQGFVGLQKEKSQAGVQFVHQRRDVSDGSSVELNGFSLFGVVEIKDGLNGFARFDKMLDANPDAADIPYLPFFTTHKSNLLIVGLDFQPIEQVHLMPNAAFIFYDEINGNAPGATIMPRFSFFITFG